MAKRWAVWPATSQLLREGNKFLLAYVILFNRVNFRQYFVCLRERMLFVSFQQCINVKFELKFAIE